MFFFFLNEARFLINQWNYNKKIKSKKSFLWSFLLSSNEHKQKQGMIRDRVGQSLDICSKSQTVIIFLLKYDRENEVKKKKKC